MVYYAYSPNFSSEHSCASPASPGADTPDFPSAVAQRLHHDDENWSNSTPPKTPPAVGQLGSIGRFGPPATHVLAAKLTELQKNQVDVSLPKKPLNRLPAATAPVPPPPPGLAGTDNGAVVSVGSIGHPHTCKQACPYVKRKGGCKDGAQCTRCHLCFWQRASVREAQRQRLLQEATVPQPVPPTTLAPPPSQPRSHLQEEAMGWHPEERMSFNSMSSNNSTRAPTVQVDNNTLNFNMHRISAYSSRSENQYSSTFKADSFARNTGLNPPTGLCPPPPPPPPRAVASMIDHGVMKLAYSGELSGAEFARQAAPGEPVPPGLTGDDEEGPASVGSIGHPHSCGQACKYHSKGKGCKDGRWCVRCHICPWRRFQQEGAKRQQPGASHSMGSTLAPSTGFEQSRADVDSWRSGNDGSFYRPPQQQQQLQQQQQQRLYQRFPAAQMHPTQC